MRRQFGKTIVELGRQDPKLLVIYGDDWTEVPGFPKYEVSRFGSFRNVGTGNRVTPRPNKDGYSIVGLWNVDCSKKSTLYVHKIVAEVFIGQCPKGLEVNHKNGVKPDCSYSNLEYLTKSQNIKHAFSSGIRKPKEGKDHPMYGRTGKSHPRYGIKHRTDSINRMSKAKTGQANPMSAESIARRDSL